MLIRIVRMTFRDGETDKFLNVFKDCKDKIRNFSGCNHLELHQDYHNKNIFSTYSHWVDDDALNNYRHSELFKQVWANTKVLFDDKPIAFSQKKHTVVE